MTQSVPPPRRQPQEAHTWPDAATLEEERKEASAPHEPGSGPTPDEAADADRSAKGVDIETVGEQYRSMTSRGAAQTGEGAIP